MSDRVKNPYCMRCGDTRGGPYGHESNECTWSRDDGHTVALPPTPIEVSKEAQIHRVDPQSVVSEAQREAVQTWLADMLREVYGRDAT